MRYPKRFLYTLFLYLKLIFCWNYKTYIYDTSVVPPQECYKRSTYCLKFSTSAVNKISFAYHLLLLLLFYFTFLFVLPNIRDALFFLKSSLFLYLILDYLFSSYAKQRFLRWRWDNVYQLCFPCCICLLSGINIEKVRFHVKQSMLNFLTDIFFLPPPEPERRFGNDSFVRCYCLNVCTDLVRILCVDIFWQYLWSLSFIFFVTQI